MSTTLTIPTKTTLRMILDQFAIVKVAYDRWSYGASEYREYGLYYSDMYSERHPEVSEAVRRLPEDLFTGRLHRQHRAIQLSRNKIILPEAMWPAQEDPKHKYLEPYLREVQRENAEKKLWDKK